MLSTLPGGKLFAECLIITLLVLVSVGSGDWFVRVAAHNNNNSSVPTRWSATNGFNLAPREFEPNTADHCHYVSPNGAGKSLSPILVVAPLLRVKGRIISPSGQSLSIKTPNHSYFEESKNARSNKRKYPSTNITIVPYVCGRVVPAPRHC
jgi:hypothetical protein